jgi:hypothetical protein
MLKFEQPVYLLFEQFRPSQNQFGEEVDGPVHSHGSVEQYREDLNMANTARAVVQLIAIYKFLLLVRIFHSATHLTAHSGSLAT